MLDDNRWTNKTWSKVSGVPLQDINSMEAEIMNRLHYRLHVGKREFEKWCLLVNSTTMRSSSSLPCGVHDKNKVETIHRLPTPPMEEGETSRRTSTSISPSFSCTTGIHAPRPSKRSMVDEDQEFPAMKRRDSPSRPFTPPSEDLL
jgi:hypothetical protein